MFGSQDQDFWGGSFAGGFSQPAQAAANKHYQWQLDDGQVRKNINNDHVIEAHYCQPGAKGIKIFTGDYGNIFIDFDKMEAQDQMESSLNVQRQTILANGEMEEMGWYYKDNRRWYEYGSVGSSSRMASVSSSDLEKQYTARQRNIHFTVGNASYRLDFDEMTQTNLSTGIKRRVRRRPKLNSVIKINSPSGFSQQSVSHIGGGWKWQFQGDEGVWTDYNSPRCSVDSDGIERCFQRNPQGQIHFNCGRFSYTLWFVGMIQTNNNIGTKRSVRRVQAEGQPADQRVVFPPLNHPATPLNSTSSLPSSAGYTWAFQDNHGMWTEYKTPNCSVDSAAIENIFQLNPLGQAKFSAGIYTYTLDFAGMYQTNDTFGTKRAVRRLLENNAQWNVYNPEAGGVAGLPVNGLYSSDSAGTQCRWQFNDVDGSWRDFVKGVCSVSSQDIENSYQQNPSGTMNFSTVSFPYELDFSAMTQRNQSTLTVRKVRRLQQ